MAIKHLWDTNTIIYYLQQQFPPQVEKFIDHLLLNEKPSFSAITEIELLSWKVASEKDVAMLHDFINDAYVIELDRPIKWKAAELRKHYAIKLPDAIIGATAILHGLTLLTRNQKDFENIAGLVCLNPWNI